MVRRLQVCTREGPRMKGNMSERETLQEMGFINFIEDPCPA